MRKVLVEEDNQMVMLGKKAMLVEEVEAQPGCLSRPCSAVVSLLAWFEEHHVLLEMQIFS